MKVLVDTSVWSLALRRPVYKLSAQETQKTAILAQLTSDARTMIIGPIRQELLSGVRDEAQFLRLRDALRAFPDEPLTTAHFEEAARMSNQCTSAGVATTPTDMLICAVAVFAKAQIFTSDHDFLNYAKTLPIQLLELR